MAKGLRLAWPGPIQQAHRSVQQAKNVEAAMIVLYSLGALAAVVLLAYLLAMLAVGRFLTYHDMFKPRPHPDGSVELEGYEYQDIEFRSPDGLTLRGWFVKSQVNPTDKTLFVIPGWLRTRTRIVPQIKFFVDSGYHVFTYDQRSHGASDTGFMTYGPKEGEDLLAAVDYAKTLDHVNAEKLAAVGFSLGAVATIYAAEKQVFKAVVLEGVFSSSYDMGEALLNKRVGERLTRFFGYAFFWVGTAIWSLGKFEHSHPVEHIGKVSPTPKLIIRGKNDERVPVRSAKQMLDAASEPKEIWIHGSGHTAAYNSYPEEYEKRVLGFLDSHV